MSKSKYLSIGCALVLLVLLVLQFVPFWSYGEADALTNVSISSYVWFPTELTGLTTQLQGSLGSDFSVNDVILFPILILLLSVAGVVFCVWKPGTMVSGVLATLAGVVGVLGYLVTPALRLGSGWVWHLIVALVALLLGAVELMSLKKKAE